MNGTNANSHRAPLRRNGLSLMFSRAKSTMEDVLSSFVKKSKFKVELQNDSSKQSLRVLSVEFEKIRSLLTKISEKEYLDTSDKIVESFRANTATLEGGLRETVAELERIRSIQENTKHPELQMVEGEMTVTSMPDSSQLDGVIARLEDISKGIGKIKLDIPPYPKQEKVVIPPYPKFPSSIEITDGKRILRELQSLNLAIKNIPKSMPEVVIPKEVTISNFPVPEEFPTRITVDNFPIQKYPNPVTNININSLRGPVLATSVNVKDTATKMPDEAIENRRSIIVFNNDDEETLYIGGSGVNVATGLPVPSKTFSPSVDLGELQDLYGCVQDGSINVRVFEASTLAVGA